VKIYPCLVPCLLEEVPRKGNHFASPERSLEVCEPRAVYCPRNPAGHQMGLT
jgi:hypothetical protein